MKFNESDLETLIWPDFLPKGCFVQLEQVKSIADPNLANEGLINRTVKIAYRTLSCSVAYSGDAFLYAIEAFVTVLTIPVSLYFSLGMAFSPKGSASQKNYYGRWLFTPGLITCLAAASKATICFALVFFNPVAVFFHSKRTPLEIFNYFNAPRVKPQSQVVTEKPTGLQVNGVSLRVQNELLDLVNWVAKEELRKKLNIDKPLSFLLTGLKPTVVKDLLNAYLKELNTAIPNKKFQLNTVKLGESPKAFDPGVVPILFFELSRELYQSGQLPVLIHDLRNKGIMVICSVEAENDLFSFVDTTSFDKIIIETAPQEGELVGYLNAQLKKIDAEFRKAPIEIPAEILKGLSYSDIDEVLLHAKITVFKDPSKKISTELLTEHLFEIRANKGVESESLEGIIPFSDLVGITPHVQEAFERLFTLIKHPEEMDELNIKELPSYLLYGPPGCGKTTLAKSVAAQLQRDFPDQQVSFHDIRLSEFSNSKVHGTTQALMEELYSILTLIDQGVLPVVFFDEIDMSLPSRKDSSFGWSDNKELLETFFLMITTLKESGAILLAATNRMDGIDPGLIRPGRFDVKIEIPLPSSDQLLDILENELSALHPNRVDVPSFSPLLSLLPGLSISDLKEGLERAKNSLIMKPAGKITVELLAKHLKLDRKEDSSLRNVIPFSELKGIPSTVQEGFKRLFVLARHPELVAELDIQGLPSYLLFGPPGCGKTTIAKSVAVELKKEFPDRKVTFHEVNLNKFSNVFIHGTSAELNQEKERILAHIEQGALPVVFFDEIDLSAPARSDQNIDWSDRKELLESFFSFIDTIKSRGAILIAATNRIESIDSALIRPGRFDAKMELPLPSHEQLYSILEGFLAKIHPNRLDIATLSQHIPNLKGFAVSDLKEAVERAKFTLFQTPTGKITTDLLIDMLSSVAREKLHIKQKG